MTPGVSKAKRQAWGSGHSSDRGKRDAEGRVGDGWQHCADRSPVGRNGEAPANVCQNTNQSITFKCINLKSTHENQVLPQALRHLS